VNQTYAVETFDLGRKFGYLTAVDNLNLKVPAGSIFGFIGPNGAGKTTTFSMLCAFIRPTSGTAGILGEDIKDFHRLSGRIGAFPQDAAFHRNVPLRTSLIFLGRLQGMDKNAASLEAERVLSMVGLSERKMEKGKNLSHGMAKRFGIAQAFIGKPELIFLDEPTSGLDPENAHTIRELIVAMKLKNTVVVSSHNLEEIEKICTDAGIIDRGRLITQGSMSVITGQGDQALFDVRFEEEFPLNEIKTLKEIAHAEFSGESGSGKLMVRFHADALPESAITGILSCLIKNKVLISNMVRGRSLEDRYLEITRK
jgi:ABC-type multidrug transport system ATPase subunit